MASIAVILTAGGSSTRFGSNKLSARLGDRSVLARTIDAFLRCRETLPIAKILVSIPPGLPDDAFLRQLGRALHEPANAGVLEFVEAGGASRAETVRNALSLLPDEIEWIAVHDAARPLVSRELIERVWAAARQYGAAAPAMSVALTIKQASGPLPARIERTVPRQTLWAMQTPQVMRRADLIDAYAQCPLPLDGVTDDVQLLELAGLPVTLVPGEERNLKLTTPLDLRLAELLLADSV